MPLDPFKDFLIACVGASASFIGLLFVALSLVLARQGTDVELEFTDRRLAESAFTALVNVFFVSLVALIPGNDGIGWAALVVAVIGLRSSWRLFMRLKEVIKKDPNPLDRRRESYWIAVSLVVYVIQGLYAVRIIMNPMNVSNLNDMMSILLVLFGAGLLRSWELTGIRQKK